MTDDVLGRFIDAWNAGERPDVDAHLERVPASARAELAADIAAFLRIAPSPPLAAADREAILADPRLRVALAAADQPGWAELLPALRTRARLPRGDLVARLAEALGVASSRERVARYYHRMETGHLPPAGVSRRVLTALATILGTGLAELEAAGEVGRPEVAPLAAPAWGRGDVAGPLLATRGQIPAETERDEVDELFLGGR